MVTAVQNSREYPDLAIHFSGEIVLPQNLAILTETLNVLRILLLLTDTGEMPFPHCLGHYPWSTSVVNTATECCFQDDMAKTVESQAPHSEYGRCCMARAQWASFLKTMGGDNDRAGTRGLPLMRRVGISINSVPFITDRNLNQGPQHFQSNLIQAQHICKGGVGGSGPGIFLRVWISQT
jgi:hypothetical protein